jgi:integrase
MAAPQTRSRQPRQMDAGLLAAEIGSFRLHLAAEGKAPKTIRLYTEAVTWFAAVRLLGKTGWRPADARDVQEWMAWLLGRYSDSYSNNQYRALQQFFRWLSVEEGIPDPMAGLRPPKWPASSSRSSPTLSWAAWNARARAVASPRGAMRPSSRCCEPPGSGCQSWPESATTRAIPAKGT